MGKKKEIIAQCTYDDRGLLIKVERTDEEIVRCKDCKYAAWWGPKGREVLDCTHLYEWDVTPDWYCAWGERKEDAKTNTVINTGDAMSTRTNQSGMNYYPNSGVKMDEEEEDAD